MRPIDLLKCLGKALVRHVGNAVGLGWAGDVAVGVSDDVWNEWNRDKDDRQRRAELAAILQTAAQEFRRQVEEVVREVAAGQPREVHERVSRYLADLPGLLRRSLSRPADRTGQSVPPDLPLRNSRDLVALLSPEKRSGEVPVAAAPRPPDASPVIKQSAAIPRVTLTVTSGPKPGEQFVFEERATWLAGRHKDCQLRVPKEKPYRSISRHHCLLDINPPDVVVRDLGSLGGTYVNGQLLGKRAKGATPDPGLASPERRLNDGDELKLCEPGPLVLRVRILIPAHCAECGAPIPEDRKADCERAPGLYQCADCHRKAAAAERPRPLRACSVCGRDVVGADGANRKGEFICAGCRGNLQQLLEQMQGGGQSVASPVPALQGYTILKKLGQGGMSAVWLARHKRTGRQVAIKLMLPEVAADDRAVKRFLLEMTGTRCLNHRHVVRLLDVGYGRGTFFLALEYCDGGTVADLVQQRGGKLPLDEAIEITLQALEGLKYAHNAFGPGKGLVHRDPAL
jgi:pSer/pThr/pTyr-binding forkhead associated (FHA) protein